MSEAPPDLLLNSIEILERRVWNALVTGDATADAQLLSEDFLGVYPDGFAERKDHAGQLSNGPTVEHFTLTQQQIRRVGSDHAMICYRAEFQRKNCAEIETMYVTSLWQQSGSTWTNVFSQDTPAQSR